MVIPFLFVNYSYPCGYLILTVRTELHPDSSGLLVNILPSRNFLSVGVDFDYWKVGAQNVLVVCLTLSICRLLLMLNISLLTRIPYLLSAVCDKDNECRTDNADQCFLHILTAFLSGFRDALVRHLVVLHYYVDVFNTADFHD